MRNWIALFFQIVRDEQGSEVVEAALLLGLIALVAMSVVSTYGTKLMARWTSLGYSLDYGG